MLFHRVRQFVKTLHPKLTFQDYVWVYQSLTSKQWSLFLQQPKAEQRHALDVAKFIAKQNESSLTSEEYTILLQAALLHDCGKICHNPSLGQRCFLVIYDRLPASLRQRSFFKHPYFALAIRIGREHPQWGKKIAAKYHIESEVIELIANHHCPRSHLEHILAQADNLC